MFEIPTEPQGGLGLEAMLPGIPEAPVLPGEALALPDLGLDSAITDAEFTFLPGDELHALTPKDEDRLAHYVRNALDQSKANMARYKEEARKDRDFYKLIQRIPAYPDGPDLTLPVTREKVDGLLAHIIEAIDLNPYFAVEAFTKQDLKVAAANERYLDREMNFGENRNQLVSNIPKEAAQVGTAFPYLEMVIGEEGEPFTQVGLATLENVFIDPLDGVNDLTHCFVGWRYVEPYHVVWNKAKAGLLDKAKCEKLKLSSSTPEAVSDSAEDGSVGRGVIYQEELRPIELYDAYIRFTPEGGETQLYHVVYSHATHTLLRATLSPYANALDAPPMKNVRFFSEANVVLGMSMGRILRSIQKFKDETANARIAYNRLAGTPPFIYDGMNRKLKAALQGGIIPGMGIPNNGPVTRRSVEYMQFPHPNITMEDMGLADQWADSATFNDEMTSGVGTSKRQTAYEVGARLNVGSLKVRVNLRDFNNDMNGLGDMVRAMVAAFKVQPQGVVKIDPGDSRSKLLAFKTLNTDELKQTLPMLVQQMAAQGAFSEGFDIMGLARSLEDAMTDNMIPGMVHPGLRVRMTGQKIISDKIATAELYESFGMYMSLLPQAQQDRRIWYFLKRICESKGIHDWAELIGEDPNTQMDPELFMAVMQPFNSLLEKSVRM